MEKQIKQAFAYRVNYYSKLDVQQSDAYTEYFAQNGIPSGSKAGVVLNMCHSLPFVNDNAMGFTAATLRNSYESAVASPINYSHDPSVILGSILKAELYDEGNGNPLTLRAISVVWKNRLNAWWVDLQEHGWSMECAYNDYSFYVAGKIIEKENAPVAWIESLDNWKNGIPVYDEKGNRVVLLLGGTDGIVEFNGLAVTYCPADKLAETLLSVASKAKNKGGQKEMFTQEQLNEAVANAVKEVENKLNAKISEMEDANKALAKKLAESESKVQALEAKASEYEAKASTLEAQIKEKEIEERFKVRQEAIASKNLVVRDEKKEFIKNADDDAFNEFIADLEAIANSLKAGMQAKASVNGQNRDGNSINLTLKDHSQIDPDSNPFL